MEPKKPAKKLVLSKETVRTLNAEPQKQGQGNAPALWSPCRVCQSTI